jgi:hypothetical protein
MARLTRLMILLPVVVAFVSTGSPAWAKGSLLYFDRLYVAPGEEVVLETTFYTNVDGLSAATFGSVNDGPYQAYLVPERRSIDPPHIPKVAVALGPILIRPGDRDEVWFASIAFVIPQVDPGRYRVELCDVPCRHDMVGDLGGSTEFNVEASAEEARLKNLLNNWVSEMIESWIPEPDTNLRPQFEAHTVEEALRDTRNRLELTEQLEELREDMVATRAELSGHDEAGFGLKAGLWLGGWMVAAGTAALWWASTRRRRVVS